MSDEIHDEAIAYTLGMLPQEEAISFEHRLCRDATLSRVVREIRHVGASLVASSAAAEHRRRAPQVAPRLEALRGRLMERIGKTGQPTVPKAVSEALGEAHFPIPGMDDPLVYADERGLVRWVNPAFSILCGHTPEELQGRTAGRMLRGPDSCPKAMERLRHAVQAHEPVLQQIVNYHKDGTAYLVEIDLRPVTGGYIALEREIPR